MLTSGVGGKPDGGPYAITAQGGGLQAAIPGLLLRVGLLTQVTGASAKASQIKVDASTVTVPAKFKECQDAHNALTGALGRLLVTVERYPDLKSNRISSHFNRECCYFVNAAQAF